ncbi:hypothetical protein CHS0354_019333 [Potamilus streckersoni]|uniref:Uncharacterized protein n=1 Tax=Potamilus streckersoni TaxID=2493646 RepID=A0AAE0SHI5_9BIVA|nr:hypothetical protein CHS0354_019333 [Potamilus streckersoni]
MMKSLTAFLLFCFCMPNVIHYGNAAGFIPVLPNGGVGSYVSSSGGAGGALALLLLLPLLFGFGGFGGLGGSHTVIITEDSHTRFANILIKRSPLTGKDLEIFSANIRLCTKANKDIPGCATLGPLCNYIPSVGLCLVA